jgi:hypothetical protein
MLRLVRGFLILMRGMRAHRTHHKGQHQGALSTSVPLTQAKVSYLLHTIS